jgi:hypothetical protein
MQTSLIGLEACSGAHFLGRALHKQGPLSAAMGTCDCAMKAACCHPSDRDDADVIFLTEVLRCACECCGTHRVTKQCMDTFEPTKSFFMHCDTAIGMAADG